jgi:hypothetical protein
MSGKDSAPKTGFSFASLLGGGAKEDTKESSDKPQSSLALGFKGLFNKLKEQKTHFDEAQKKYIEEKKADSGQQTKQINASFQGLFHRLRKEAAKIKVQREGGDPDSLVIKKDDKKKKEKPQKEGLFNFKALMEKMKEGAANFKNIQETKKEKSEK